MLINLLVLIHWETSTIGFSLTCTYNKLLSHVTIKYSNSSWRPTLLCFKLLTDVIHNTLQSTYNVCAPQTTIPTINCDPINVYCDCTLLSGMQIITSCPPCDECEEFIYQSMIWHNVAMAYLHIFSVVLPLQLMVSSIYAWPLMLCKWHKV